MGQEYSNRPGRNDFVSEIHREHHEALFSFAVSLCHQYFFDISYVDDLMQDFYLAVLDKYDKVLPGYEKYGAAYLAQIMRFDIVDMTRKRKKIGNWETGYAQNAPMATDIYHLCFELYEKQFLNNLRTLLSEEDFQLMKLYLEGYSYQEIGQRLQMNPNTVGVKIHRNKKFLFDHLGGHLETGSLGEPLLTH